MAKLGKVITIRTNSTIIAAVKSDDIKTAADTIETASATESTWRTFRAGRKDWGFSVNYLVTNMTDLLNVGTTYDIGILDNAVEILTGSAILTECQISSNVGGIVNGSFSFKGTGALTNA